MGTHQPYDVKTANIPESLPTSTPSVTSSDHSFTLQAVMDLQRSAGALTSAVNALTKSQKDLSKKIERVEERLSGVTHKLYAAGVVLVLALSVSGWVLNASWGLLKEIAAPAIKAAIQE